VKAQLILADAGSAHPDGTFSLLRGGINEIQVPPNHPVRFKGALIARVVGSRGEAGRHEFRISCLNEDGAVVPSSEVSGTLEIPPQGGVTQIVVDLSLLLPRLGRYEFSIAVDKHQLDAWPLEAKEKRS